MWSTCSIYIAPYAPFTILYIHPLHKSMTSYVDTPVAYFQSAVFPSWPWAWPVVCGHYQGGRGDLSRSGWHFSSPPAVQSQTAVTPPLRKGNQLRHKVNENWGGVGERERERIKEKFRLMVLSLYFSLLAVPWYGVAFLKMRKQTSLNCSNIWAPPASFNTILQCQSI